MPESPTTSAQPDRRWRGRLLAGALGVVVVALAATAVNGAAASAATPGHSLTSATGDRVGVSSLFVVAGSLLGGDPLTLAVQLVDLNGAPNCAGVTTDTAVNLSSGNPAVVNVPAQVVVPAGQCTADFTASTGTVTTQTRVSISAVTADDRRPAIDGIAVDLVINPKQAGPLDQVAVTVARYSATVDQSGITHGELIIDATSSNPAATLTVFLSTPNPSPKVMTSDGQGGYTLDRSIAVDPFLYGPITVTSNFGGVAAVNRPLG